MDCPQAQCPRTQVWNWKSIYWPVAAPNGLFPSTDNGISITGLEHGIAYRTSNCNMSSYLRKISPNTKWVIKICLVRFKKFILIEDEPIRGRRRKSGRFINKFSRFTPLSFPLLLLSVFNSNEAYFYDRSSIFGL